MRCTEPDILKAYSAILSSHQPFNRATQPEEDFRARIFESVLATHSALA